MPGFHLPRRTLLVAIGLTLTCHAAWAQAPTDQSPIGSTPDQRQSPVPGGVGGTPAAEIPSPANGGPGLFSDQRTSLLGDAYGIRTKLADYGISVGLLESSEVFGNATGGVHRGADYDGLTLMSMGIDTGKAVGLDGGTLQISAFQIHGRQISADNLYTLQTASGQEAQRATRLWELWYDQTLLDGHADLKIGQQSIDNEFMYSSGSSLFINTMMGWPLIPSVDLYAGGPSYPLSSLGVRLRGQPTGNLTLLGGVFDDNPPGGRFDNDSQVRGAEQSGTAFNVNTGALFIAEAQYAINQPALGDMDYGDRDPGLPGLYKIGAWFDTGNFPDQRFGTDGLSLADPNSNGETRYKRHNYSIYAVADQLVWRPDPHQPQALGVFMRVMGAPGDRNLADFSLNGGLTWKALIPGRDNDTFGIGYGLAKISQRATDLDQDTNAFSGIGGPIRTSESFIELTYQAQLAGWWSVQPDIQYTFMPGGGLANPNNPSKRIGNEAVFGLRTSVTF